MLLTAAVIWVLDPGPVVFRQLRIGAGGRVFRVLKFRTMRTDADAMLARLLAANPVARREWMARQKLEVDPRVTALGNFLRRSSIDELPQLLNVLKGEMSLVGPRPSVPDESDRYGFRLRSYLSVKPGLTGLWQVSGRNNTTYAHRVALDVSYSRKLSLALDFKILLATIPAVLASEGCY
jgi:exopolysaccharide production protein ExoY